MAKKVIPLLLTGLVLACACSRSDKLPKGASVDTLSPAQLHQAYASPAPDAQGLLDKIDMSFRSSMYRETLIALDQLTNLPNTTAPQKQAVAQFAEGVKKRMERIEAEQQKFQSDHR